MGAEAQTAAQADSSNKNNKYRKHKPWDHDGIDHWAITPFDASQSSGPFLEQSSFATLFPQYREKYLQHIWRAVREHLSAFGVHAQLDVREGSMTVCTTRRTSDPFAIVKARDLIKLLARSVPLAQAAKIMRDDVNCDIVNIGGFVHNKERFVKRRQRLIGPNGSTLKAIELLTECYMLVQGNTVACMGSYKALKQARRIVEDCMRNVHPVYNIKALMIKRELAKDERLKHHNWQRFLPKFKRNNVRKSNNGHKQARKRAKQKAYEAFPPLPRASKLDVQLQSGEYFMSEQHKRRKRATQQKVEREQVSAQRQQQKRQRAYEAPDEQQALQHSRKRRREQEAQQQHHSVHSLAKRVKRRLRDDGGGAAA